MFVTAMAQQDWRREDFVLLGPLVHALNYQSEMTIKGIGLDIIAVERIASMVKRFDYQTLSLVFTSNELNCCCSANSPEQAYAICFATKEAVGKALGSGLVDIGWNEIESYCTSDRLTIQLSGSARQHALKKGINQWLANWCLWRNHVLVQVIAH